MQYPATYSMHYSTVFIAIDIIFPELTSKHKMRLRGLLVLTLLTSVSADTSRRYERPMSSEAIARAKLRVIAARKALQPRGSRAFTDSHCPESCICGVAKQVSCNATSLKRIPRGFPAIVEKLNLGMNKIGSLQRKDFKAFGSNLLELDLHDNEIAILGNGIFGDTKNLQVLQLSQNRIEDIRKTSFRGLRNIRSLHLDHNRISKIHPLAFRSLTRLEFLQLAHNQIRAIDKGLFVTLHFQRYFKYSSLRNLHLENNKITNLPRHVFDHMDQDASIHLSENPLYCSCQSRWLSEQWNRRCDIGCPLCHSPERARGLPLNSSVECSRSPTKEIRSIETENDLILFENSNVTMTLGIVLHSNHRSLMTLRCELANEPITSVRQMADQRLRASFESQFRCSALFLSLGLSEEVVRMYERHSIRLIPRNGRSGFTIEVPGVEQEDALFTGATIGTDSEFLVNSNEVTIRFWKMSNFYRLELNSSFSQEPHLVSEKFSKPAWVQIRYPDPALIDVKLLEAGKKFSTKCKAVGQPKPSVTWVLPSGEKLGAGEESGRHSVMKSGKLNIRNLSPDDSGIYRCIANVEEAADLAAVKIGVVATDGEPQTSPNQEFVSKGGNWTSQCKIESLQFSKTAWILPDGHVIAGDGVYRHGQVTTHHNGTISVTHFRPAYQGLYLCVGSNVEGDEIYRVQVHISAIEDDDIVENTIVDESEEEMDLIETEVVEEIELSEYDPDSDPDFEYYDSLDESPFINSIDPIMDQSPEPTSKYEDFLKTPSGRADKNVRVLSTVRTHRIPPTTNSRASYSTDSPKLINKQTSGRPYFEKPESLQPEIFDPKIRLVGELRSTNKDNNSIDILTQEMGDDALLPDQTYEIIDDDMSIPDQMYESNFIEPELDSKMTRNQTELFNESNSNSIEPGFDDAPLDPPLDSPWSSFFEYEIQKAVEPESSNSTTAWFDSNTTPNSTELLLLNATQRGAPSNNETTSNPLPSQYEVTSRDLDLAPTTQTVVTTQADPMTIPDTTAGHHVTVPDRNEVFEILDDPETGRKPTVLRGNRVVVHGRQGGKVLLPCSPSQVGFRSYSWTLPSGEEYKRPDKLASRDWTKYVHRNGSLLVTRLKPQDAGDYYCVALDNNNVEYRNRVYVFVLERLRIRNPANEYLRVKIGSDVTLPCDTTGNPEPKIVWRSPWGEIASLTRYVEGLEVLWNGSLRIPNMRAQLSGLFECVARTELELRTRKVSISMMRFPPRFVSPPSGMFVVKLGKSISLPCAAEGFPEPETKWMLAGGGSIRPNEAIFSGSDRTVPKLRVEKNGNLLIRNAERRDAGTYHCVISNYLGQSASKARLLVTD